MSKKVLHLKHLPKIVWCLLNKRAALFIIRLLGQHFMAFKEPCIFPMSLTMAEINLFQKEFSSKTLTSWHIFDTEALTDISFKKIIIQQNEWLRLGLAKHLDSTGSSFKHGFGEIKRFPNTM